MMEFVFKDNYATVQFDYGQLTTSSDETYGFRPYQLMVSAIASCSGSVFKRILRKQRIEIEGLTITATVHRNEQEANRIEQIDLTFKVKGNHLNKDKLAKSLAIASKNCSMVKSVEGSIKITETVEIVS